MIIIAGYSLIDADTRDSAVAAFAEMVARAKKSDGCLDVAISADSVDPKRINVFELQEARVKLYRTEKAEGPF